MGGIIWRRQVQAKEVTIEDDRTGLSVETLRRAILDNLYYIQGKFPAIATKHDMYMAVAYTVRDRLVRKWINTVETDMLKDVRVVCYLSAEFLIGPQLANNLVSMGLLQNIREAVASLGQDLDELIDLEEEPGLGNGGLGRLAACYLDSLATLDIPSIGYGLRYEFGIFDQEIRDGWQVEKTDKWLRLGYPWEIARREAAVTVQIGGHTESYIDEDGSYRVRWVPARYINGVPYDTPVVGYNTNTANTLRLWCAEAPESFNFHAFDSGDYIGAVSDKVFSENISKVLYPNDNTLQGKQLRLEQQYFFVACSLQDIIRLHFREGDTLDNLHEKFSLQLNDTHPSVAVAELMRLLVDEYKMDWDKAWSITSKTFAYTNHTLLPEALEKWPVDLFKSILPRHMEIIYEINKRFLEDVKKRFPDDPALLSRLSLIDESGPRYVRMAHLACVGSYAVNGVAALHSELLKTSLLSDFNKIWPGKIINVTNGVTPRRFMVVSNPELSDLITEKIGNGWISDLSQLHQLESFIEDKEFISAWQKIKLDEKTRLAAHIHKATGIGVDPTSLFDIQSKRIHEYKRQHLNVLHIISLYNKIKKNPKQKITPRTFIFAGKAAPGYFMAKLIIKLINSVAAVVNDDHDVAGRIKVVFVPDFNVRLGQRIYPAADLSEQISTAGKEASGTGNMKFALNGSLTIGTLDGANVEMLEEIGADDFFLFGLTVEQVTALKKSGYKPYDYYAANADLKEAVDLIANGHFSPEDHDLFAPLIDSLMQHDEYLLFADFAAYAACQEKAAKAYLDEKNWAKMSVRNVARMGKFSSDRSIREYCNLIWHADPVGISLVD
ncbi:MAG: glycogen/starch/alpha-glucan phosphorylase [Candidatus Obscuribacterales bacterium]|nr:glycogen/starch/alpha-glucan phosphorylase [Candidatus Obscuribacterales bacterium]